MQRSLQEEVRLLLAKRSRRKRRVKVQPPGCFLYEQVLLSFRPQHNEYESSHIALGEIPSVNDVSLAQGLLRDSFVSREQQVVATRA